LTGYGLLPRLGNDGAEKLLAAWVDLGIRDYKWAIGLQEHLLAARLRGLLGPVVLLQRNYPVVTVGRQGSAANILADADTLRALGIDVVAVARGGDVTYHDTGQLIVSPLLHLREIGMDAHAYMRSVEEAILRLLASYHVRGELKAGYPGVWVGDRKIASVGFALRRWVTFHGFSINVSADLRGFRLVRPCGLPGNPMTSLELELGKSVAFDDVKARLRDIFAEIFSLSFEDVSIEYVLREEAGVGAG
jgi:lipoate-protein ligase B